MVVATLVARDGCGVASGSFRCQLTQQRRLARPFARVLDEGTDLLCTIAMPSDPEDQSQTT
ncbi:MAG: hypothetical protein CMO30_15555 [Tistrella sp.]|uniref:Uncharacterized protein n=1 Tax=Tistrella mobilis TaxID=171437 RepID=A0A3B9IK12_9PROT|nr:hypothetical protein [Tistrella sp.]MBA76684.1 hypothetical protein [Tistrella sp.]HAE48056.1 hypothetical protein [Tistrella mobilis]